MTQIGNALIPGPRDHQARKHTVACRGQAPLMLDAGVMEMWYLLTNGISSSDPLSSVSIAISMSTKIRRVSHHISIIGIGLVP